MSRPRTLEEQWRERLEKPHAVLKVVRRLFGSVPSPPRCEICSTPFRGPFAPLLRALGRGPFSRNPRFCDACCGVVMREPGSGAEVGMSALFADVRGSTPLAEELGGRALHELMDRFYTTGIDVLMRGGAIVDRFMGDQVVGYFVPGLAGAAHARRAIETGLELLRATGNDMPEPWIRIGVGAHTGRAFVGTVGRESGLIEMTALGEDVNIAARLASIAAAGELVVSEAAFAAAGVDVASEPRTVELKGVSAPVNVRVIRADRAAIRAK